MNPINLEPRKCAPLYGDLPMPAKKPKKTQIQSTVKTATGIQQVDMTLDVPPPANAPARAHAEYHDRRRRAGLQHLAEGQQHVIQSVRGGNIAAVAQLAKLVTTEGQMLEATNPGETFRFSPETIKENFPDFIPNNRWGAVSHAPAQTLEAVEVSDVTDKRSQDDPGANGGPWKPVTDPLGVAAEHGRQVKAQREEEQRAALREQRMGQLKGVVLPLYEMQEAVARINAGQDPW